MNQQLAPVTSVLDARYKRHKFEKELHHKWHVIPRGTLIDAGHLGLHLTPKDTLVIDIHSEIILMDAEDDSQPPRVSLCSNQLLRQMARWDEAKRKPIDLHEYIALIREQKD